MIKVPITIGTTLNFDGDGDGHGDGYGDVTCKLTFRINRSSVSWFKLRNIKQKLEGNKSPRETLKHLVGKLFHHLHEFQMSK